MSKTKISDYDPLLFQGIAHRGLWNEEYTENGMKAFKNAIDHHCAFELDIHLTKDGELVVCHDGELERTTGKKGRIEHLTLAEIKRDYRLHDGGEIPTMKEVLELTNEQVPIVVELKVEEKNYKALGKKAAEFFKDIKDKTKITFISFDPRALHYARKAPYTRGLLLIHHRYFARICRHMNHYLDVEDVLVDKKAVVSYRKKGHPINVWTIEKEEDLVRVAPYVDMITFQKLPLERVREEIAKYRK